MMEKENNSELIITILFGWLGVHKFMEKETVLGDGSSNSDNLKTRRYKIDIDKSFTKYDARNKLQK